MIDQVNVLNLHKSVDTLLLKEKKINSIITVIDPQRAAFIEAFHRQLLQIDTSRFYFYDVSDTECSRPPCVSIISSIIDKLLSLHKSTTNYNCLIHCYAGRQRSTAVAYIALAIKNNFNYFKSLDELYQIRRKAFPNNLILELADSVLDTQLEKHFYDYIYKKRIVRKYDNHYIKYIKDNNL